MPKRSEGEIEFNSAKRKSVGFSNTLKAVLKFKQALKKYKGWND